ncbi:DUF6332 family protein [Streptomyces sp. NBC_01304]|uniref:DUF6332 family protein n=1 Tax=Streptomyces sp. NBC_01304 TaxID=2903818 RepID=UPI002E0D5D32|nr:DUF6332 family protein [Streptomyces sp. NBC_01304]
MTPRRRSQVERDEATVEIGFALASACFLGAVALAALCLCLHSASRRRSRWCWSRCVDPRRSCPLAS